MVMFKNSVGRPSNETIKKRNIFKVVVLILFIIIIGLVVYILNDKGIIKIKEKDNKNKENNKQKEVINKENEGWYEPKGTAKTIDIYTYKYDTSEENLYITSNYEETKKSNPSAIYNNVGTYKCSSEDCMLITNYISSSEIDTVGFLDGDYVIYNFVTNKAKKINFGEYKDKVNFLKKEQYNIGMGDLTINPYKKGNYKYYSFTIGTENLDSIGFVNQALDVITFITDSDVVDDGNYITHDRTFENYEFYDDGSLIYSSNNKIYKYNYNDNKIEEGRQYNDVVSIAKGYITVVDNDKYLKVLDRNEKELSKLVKITDDMTVHSLLSGWYEQNKKEGKYVVVQDPSVQMKDLSDEIQKDIGYSENGYDFGYEYYYIPETKESGKIATYIGGYAKPVLYLYPKEDNTKVTVSFEKPDLLTTTYPKFNKKWEVIANKNGDLHDNNGRYYYGLYWEEAGSNKVSFDTGFFVTKDNALKFLEEKLDNIGLNEREANEFIMYWLPILEKNNKSLVYFELTQERDKYNKLYVNPKPDAQLRIAIHVKKVNKKINIKPQTFTKFKRSGFTIVEWGGVTY